MHVVLEALFGTKLVNIVPYWQTNLFLGGELQKCDKVLWGQLMQQQDWAGSRVLAVFTQLAEPTALCV